MGARRSPFSLEPPRVGPGPLRERPRRTAGRVENRREDGRLVELPDRVEAVAAYVERAGGLYRQWFVEATADGEPADRITSLFDALIEQVQPGHCRGCPFLMAMAESADASAKAHALAVDTKAWVREKIGELTARLSVKDPAVLADQIFLVMEGVYASVQSHGADGPARQARGLVEALLRRAR